MCFSSMISYAHKLDCLVLNRFEVHVLALRYRCPGHVLCGFHATSQGRHGGTTRCGQSKGRSCWGEFSFGLLNLYLQVDLCGIPS